MLDSIDLSEGRPRLVGRLVAYDGLMLEATGFGRPIGSGARVIAADGRAARAEVVGFRGDRTLLMALDGDAAHASGARVEPDSSGGMRSEEHTSELQSLMRISYAVFCLKKKNQTKHN